MQRDRLTHSRKAGECGCGSDLVKGAVSRVEGDKIFVTMDGKERAFSAKAKYSCSCGETCTCGTISQKPGTCGCGAPLMEVK